MTPLDKFKFDCLAEGYNVSTLSTNQVDGLLTETLKWCNKEQIDIQRKELDKLKLEGKYPIMDPHEGYGDPEIDAEFICSCNALHINADNGIQMGLYVLDKLSGKYIPKNLIIHKKLELTFSEKIASIFGIGKSS